MENRNIQWQTQTVLPGQSSAIPIGNTSILFKNTGGTVAYVNGLELQPGESFALDCVQGEYDTTKWIVNFGPGGSGRMYVIRKIYVK